MFFKVAGYACVMLGLIGSALGVPTLKTNKLFIVWPHTW